MNDVIREEKAVFYANNSIIEEEVIFKLCAFIVWFFIL